MANPLLTWPAADARQRIHIEPAGARVGPARVRRRLKRGAIDVAVPCANVPAFRSWVLGLLDHAEVLRPASVRADVVEWLRALAGDQ